MTSVATLHGRIYIILPMTMRAKEKTVGSSARARLVVFEHEWNGRKAEGTRTRAVPHGGEEEPLEPYYQER